MFLFVQKRAVKRLLTFPQISKYQAHFYFRGYSQMTSYNLGGGRTWTLTGVKEKGHFGKGMRYQL